MIAEAAPPVTGWTAATTASIIVAVITFAGVRDWDLAEVAR